MLTIIDRYIIKKYLITFLFTIVMITMVSVCINYFENVDKFLSAGLPLGQIFKDYYLNFIPWINGLLWPIFALLAVIFFTSRIARDTEVIAMLGSGMSYGRFIRPYLIGAMILATLLWIGSNHIIPKSTRIKNEFETDFLKKGGRQTLSNDVHFYVSPTDKVYFRMFSIRDSSARNFRLERFENNKLKYVLKTDKLTYVSSKKSWEMGKYEERWIDSTDERLLIVDTKRYEKYNFHPDDFIRHTKQMEMMTSKDLRKFIKAEESKGLGTADKFLVELYRRTADPFTIIILTLIGASLASRKVRGGLGLHLASGVILGAVYVILSKFAVTFVTNLHFSPFIGVWIPNIIFGAVAILLYKKAQQ